MLTLERISGIGSQLYQYLRMFADCFSRRAGRQLLRIHVRGQLSDIQRKNYKAIALTFHKAPRTFNRFLESIEWNEEQLGDRCQQIVARDHAYPDAIGSIDESGTYKSGENKSAHRVNTTAIAAKIENCTMGVHHGCSAPGLRPVTGRLSSGIKHVWCSLRRVST